MRLWNPIVWKHRSEGSIGRVGGCAEQSADRGYYLFLIGSGKKDSNFYRISLPFCNSPRPWTSRYDTKCKLFSSSLYNAIPLRWILQARPLFPAFSSAAKWRLLTFCVWNICCYFYIQFYFMEDYFQILLRQRYVKALSNQIKWVIKT